MSRHTLSVKGKGAEEYAYCKCGANSLAIETKQEAEDWHYHHMQDVLRFRARMKGGPASLASSRDYYEQMASDPGQSESDRRLWQQMADEISHRLNDRGSPGEGQATLDF